MTYDLFPSHQNKINLCLAGSPPIIQFTTAVGKGNNCVYMVSILTAKLLYVYTIIPSTYFLFFGNSNWNWTRSAHSSGTMDGFAMERQNGACAFIVYLSILNIFSTPHTHGTNPLFSVVCLSVCSNNRDAREMPATAEVVIEEGLPEHLVHMGFVDVICTGKRPDIVCKHAKDYWSLHG